MSELTSTGFKLTRLDERFVQLQQAMRIIFGDDINVDPNSPDGQTIGIFAESINNLEQLAEQVYQSFNPNTAIGAALSRLVMLNAIQRTPGAFSTAVLTLTGTYGTLVPAGSLVKSADDSTTWKTVGDATIGLGGTVDIEAQASEFGALLASANTITKIVTPIYGWQSVTNASSAVPGLLEETDEHLRIRRAASTTTSAQAVIDAVRGALLNQSGVTEASVYENATAATDANGLPAHSMYAVVQGGDDTSVAEVLWFKKSAGVLLYGGTTVPVFDTMGNSHDIHFDRPIPENVYIIVNLHTMPGWPTDGAAKIKAAIVDWALNNQRIGLDVFTSRLYTPINSVPGHTVASLFIGTAPGPSSSADLVIPFNGMAIFDVSRIVVNEL